MGIKAAILSAPAGRLTGVPVVWHKVDFSYDRSLARPTAASVRGVIGVSEAVHAGLVRSGAGGWASSSLRSPCRSRRAATATARRTGSGCSAA